MPFSVNRRNLWRVLLATAIGLSCAAPSMAQDITGTGAESDWRKTLGTFRVGVLSSTVSDTNPDLIAAVETRLSVVLKMPVRLILFRTLAAMIDAQATSRIAYGIYSGAAYATLDAFCTCVRPVVAPTRIGGIDGVAGILAADPDRMTGLVDLGGEKIAWPTGDLSPVTLLARAQFNVLGLPLRGDEPFLVDVESEEVGREQLQSKAVSAAFLTAEVASSGLVEPEGPAGSDILWRSDTVPFGPHAILGLLPDEAAQALRDLFLAMNDPDDPVRVLLNEGFTGPYRPVTVADYAPLADAMRALKRR